MKKFLRIFLIVLFPLGIAYCVGRALFTGSGFASYLGMFFIFGFGVLLGIYLENPEIVRGWFQTVAGWIGG